MSVVVKPTGAMPLFGRFSKCYSVAPSNSSEHRPLAVKIGLARQGNSLMPTSEHSLLLGMLTGMLLSLALWNPAQAVAGEITVAAASDLTFAFKEVAVLGATAHEVLDVRLVQLASAEHGQRRRVVVHRTSDEVSQGPALGRFGMLHLDGLSMPHGGTYCPQHVRQSAVVAARGSLEPNHQPAGGGLSTRSGWSHQ